MQSVGKVTEDLINKSPFLRESMTENLINLSALARKLQPEIEEIMGKEVREGAIVMAIKRMTPGLYHKVNLKIKHVIGDLGDFLVRSNLVDFTYFNSTTIHDAQTEFMGLLSKDRDSFYAFARGVNETSIITLDKYADDIREIFRRENLVAHNSNLASVTVKLPQVNVEIYGIYYYLLKQLAWEGINVCEVVSTANEFTVIVKQDDVDRAFKIMMDVKKGV